MGFSYRPLTWKRPSRMPVRWEGVLVPFWVCQFHRRDLPWRRVRPPPRHVGMDWGLGRRQQGLFPCPPAPCFLWSCSPDLTQMAFLSVGSQQGQQGNDSVCLPPSSRAFLFFWLHWVFVAACRGFSLAEVYGSFSSYGAQAHLPRGMWGPSF